jgi:hypothetical protein
MTLAMSKGDNRAFVAQWMQPVRDLVRPVSEGFFAGVLDISNVPSLSDRIKFRISVLMGVWTEGDHRDWAAIRAWAASLRPLLLRWHRPLHRSVSRRAAIACFPASATRNRKHQRGLRYIIWRSGAL